MLNKESFKPLLGDWYDKLVPLFDCGEMDKIYDFLKSEAKAGRKIAPDSSDTFKAFEKCQLANLKCVIVGLCPYHSLKDGIVVADGLAMSCSKTGVLQPSLRNFYRGLEEEFCQGGMCLEQNWSPDLSYLAEQGVLLYNIALTTEIGKPGKHNEIWAPFTQFLLENVISVTGAPVVFLGKEAAEFKRYLAPMQWHFELPHPAAAAYSGTEWKTEGVFKKVNKILHDTNGMQVWWIDDMPF